MRMIQLTKANGSPIVFPIEQIVYFCHVNCDEKKVKNKFATVIQTTRFGHDSAVFVKEEVGFIKTEIERITSIDHLIRFPFTER